MTLSLSKNVPSLMAMTLGMVSMITPIDAKIVSCDLKSPQCCWVIRSWQLMEKTTSVSSTDATACCYYLGSATQSSGIPGVTCSSTGIVTEIHWWSQAKPKKSIPAELGELTNLQTLDLRNNTLIGTIPAELGSLTNLVVLNLIHNQLSGSIPAKLGNLRNLQSLFLDFNKLSDSIPAELGNLTNLTKLYVSFNNLSDSIPAELGNLTKLIKLDLRSNQLTGSIPSSLGKLTNLEELNLRSNQLTGSIPSSFGNLKNLQSLYLFHNRLNGSIPSSIGNLRNLQLLYLYKNTGLTGTFTTRPEVKIEILGTNVTICGGAAAENPPGSYPPSDTSPECLASGRKGTLAKRTGAFSKSIGNYKFTCNVDRVHQNPYADCLNSLAALCNPATWDSFSTKNTCRDAVDRIFGQMNTYWQDVRKECGQWSFNGKSYTGDSKKCNDANTNLREKAYYILPDGDKVPVDSVLTNSIKIGLWSNNLLA